MGSAKLIVAQSNDISIIPYPREVLKLDGAFSITPFTKIIVQERKNKSVEELQWVAQYLHNHLFGRDTSSKKFNTMHSIMMRPQRIVLSVKNYFKEIGTEGYKLSVFPDVIIVSGNTPQGVFYGVQTLLQLAKPVKIAGQELYYQVQGVQISDFPKFGWRGMHLDCAKHFFEVDFIKKYIDLLAFHKMNTFHWHLADDYGWRIEIKKYPKLTSVGAWRKDERDLDWYADSSLSKRNNPKRYGGFYTQEEITEVIDYAKKRFVAVVPAIEMPGHIQSAMAAYPQYACSGKKVNVSARACDQLTEPFCPTDSTFRFLEDILTEVFTLFPSSYVHVGGDEINKKYWKSSAYVKNLMLQKGFSSYDEVHGYFMQKIERIVTVNGKKMIVWDEVLSNNLPTSTNIMSRRGDETAISAAKANHFVVISSKSHLSFDALNEADENLPLHAVTSLETVYNYNPIPKELSFEQSLRIMGVEANVSTQYMQTPEKVEEMVLPRMCALSELGWVSPNNKDFKRFSQNLPKFLTFLKDWDYYGFVSKPKLENSNQIFIDSKELRFQDEKVNNVVIKYTLDGSDPKLNGKKYVSSILIENNTVLKAVCATDFGTSDILEIEFTKQKYIESTFFTFTNSGLNFSYYEGDFFRFSQIDSSDVVRKGTISQIKIPSYVAKDFWATIFSGYIFIPKDDIYTFYLSTDDAANLYIDNQKIVEQFSMLGQKEKKKLMALKKGFHRIKCSYFENSGTESLSLSWSSDSFKKQTIPPEVFFRE